VSPLSRRQREVALLVAAGRTNRQIARALGITEKTVEVHLSQAMRRIDAHNRSEVAIHVVDAGLRLAGGPRPVAGSTG
jgi:DNA-binding NarL/FixJ family response regulator